MKWIISQGIINCREKYNGMIYLLANYFIFTVNHIVYIYSTMSQDKYRY